MKCLQKQGLILEREREVSICNVHKTDDQRVAIVVRGEWSMEWKR